MFYNWGTMTKTMTKTKTLAAFIILAIFEYEGPWKRCKLCWKLLHCNTVMLQQNIDVWLSPPPPHIVWWRGRDCEEAIEIMLKGTVHVMDRSLFLTWTGTWVICIIGEWLGKPGKWQFFLWKKKKLPNRGLLTLVQVRILKLIVKIDFNGNIAYLFILTVRWFRT